MTITRFNSRATAGSSKSPISLDDIFAGLSDLDAQIMQDLQQIEQELLYGHLLQDMINSILAGGSSLLDSLLADEATMQKFMQDPSFVSKYGKYLSIIQSWGDQAQKSINDLLASGITDTATRNALYKLSMEIGESNLNIFDMMPKSLSYNARGAYYASKNYITHDVIPSIQNIPQSVQNFIQHPHQYDYIANDPGNRFLSGLVTTLMLAPLIL